MTDSPFARKTSLQISDSVIVSRGASYLVMQTLITSAGQIIAFAFLARLISLKEMGILAVLSLVIALCQAIDGGALSQSATKFIGELEGNPEVASSIFYQAFRISFFISIPIAVAVFLSAPTLASLLLAEDTFAYLFRVLAIDMLIYAGTLPVAIGTLYGLKKFKAASTIGTAGNLLRQCLILLLIIWMKDFVGLVIAWVLSDLITLVLYCAYILHDIGVPHTVFSARKLLTFSWPLSIGSIISFGYSWFDRALLVVFVPLASLGIYNAALVAYGVLGAVTTAASNALLPIYSRISSRQHGRLVACRRATLLASRYSSLTIVPLAFGFVATAQPALTLFVGQAYSSGAEPLMILSCAFAITAFSVVLSPMLLALSETRIATVITAGTVLAGLISAFVFLPMLGINGASIARALAVVVSAFLTIIILRRKQAVSLDLQAIWKSLVAGSIMTGVLFITQMIFYSRYYLPIYVLIGGITYLTALRLLKAVKEEDVRLIEQYLGPRFAFALKLLDVIHTG